MDRLTTAEEVVMMATAGSCQCERCKRTTRYGQIISKLSDEEDQRFMLDLYDELAHLEFDVDMLELEQDES